MFQEITRDTEIGSLIDQYKNETEEPLTKDEICGILKLVYESIALMENVMTPEEVEKRNLYTDPLINQIEREIKQIVKQALDNTPIQDNLKPAIIKRITDPIKNWIDNNTIY